MNFDLAIDRAITRNNVELIKKHRFALLVVAVLWVCCYARYTYQPQVEVSSEWQPIAVTETGEPLVEMWHGYVDDSGRCYDVRFEAAEPEPNKKFCVDPACVDAIGIGACGEGYYTIEVCGDYGVFYSILEGDSYEVNYVEEM